MTIATFDRNSLNVLRARMNQALETLGDELGIKLSTGKISFNSSNCQITVEAATVATSGVVQSQARASFVAYAAQWGLHPDDFGQTFTGHEGTLYKITGLRPSAPKFPIIGERVTDGKQFKFPAAIVKRGLPPRARSLAA